MARRGLYCPSVHPPFTFRDEAWLKLSLLYWDDITRLVPKGFSPEDSDDVIALEEAGIIRRVDPTVYERAANDLFSSLLERHGSELGDIYKPSNSRFPDFENIRRGRRGRDGFAFVRSSQVSSVVSERLIRQRLAIPGPYGKFLALHPRLGAAYQSAVVNEVCLRRGLVPIADGDGDAPDIYSHGNVDGLARLLLGSPGVLDAAPGMVQLTTLMRATPNVSADRIATVIMRSVLSEGLEKVPAKEIIRLRTDSAGARHRFHTYVDYLRKQLRSAQIVETSVLDEHIVLEFERRLKPELIELRRQLRSLSFGTVLGITGVGITLPMGSLLSISPIGALAASAGAGLGIAALSHKQREAARGLLASGSAAGFLWLVQNLTPPTFVERARKAARRFMLGV